MNDTEHDSAPRRALVVEDDDFTRALVQSVVESLGFTVEAAPNAAAALDVVEPFDPDVAIVDLDLGEGPNGLELLDIISRSAPWVAGILLTSFRSPALVDNETQLPKGNYIHVHKGEIKSIETLSFAIETAIAGAAWTNSTDGELPSITKQQAELLKQIAEGLNNDEIARQRGCTTRAIERMSARLYAALNVGADPTTNPRVVAVRAYLSGDLKVR